MAFRVERVTVYGGFPSVKIFDAAADDVAVRVVTGSSYDVSVGGSALSSSADGVPSALLGGWVTVTAGDELWAIRDGAGDVAVSVLVRSDPA